MLYRHFKPSYIIADQGSPPELIVVVDTEEEFDWSQAPRREATNVSSMQEIYLVQDILNEYGLIPLYAVDYPVATQADGIEPLKDILDKGQCEIGTHLHPWVNPPYNEELNSVNTYPGNLSRSLERSKIQVLTDAITESFELRPVVYKAGRYGIGPNTPNLLCELGYTIDVSLCPPVDYRSDGGPDFRNFSAQPFWFRDDLPTPLLELPVTGAYAGWGGAMKPYLYDTATHFPPSFKVHGILARTRIVDRLMLSPEGYTSEEHVRLVKFLYNLGLRTFTWSFHSPSVKPGCTTYVQSKPDLRIFLDRFKRFFDFFFGEMGGIATTPSQILNTLEH